MTQAARAVGFSRRTAYNYRESDPEFAAEWDDAIEEAVELLELEARRRAYDGVDEPVFYRGMECGVVRKYSDNLTMFLLKAHKPEKYRERSEVKHSGGVTAGVMIMPGTTDPTEWDAAAAKVREMQDSIENSETPDDE